MTELRGSVAAGSPSSTLDLATQGFPFGPAVAGCCCGVIVKLGLNNGATNDAAPESECAAKGGEKSTKVGHSVRSGIGGNLPGKVPPLSLSAFVFHMFRFLSPQERQHMGPNFQLLSPLSQSQSTSVVTAARNSIEKKRKTQWPECSSGGNIFLAFSHRSARGQGGGMNCRWRRRRRRHILYDGNRRRRRRCEVLGQKRKTLCCFRYSVSLSLSLSPLRILSHCREQRQTRIKPSRRRRLR